MKELNSRDWVCEDVEKVGRYLTAKDLFGIWDIIAIKPNRTKLIQVKTNRKPSLTEYKNFQEFYKQFECEVWVWIDRKGFDKTKLY